MGNVLYLVTVVFIYDCTIYIYLQDIFTSFLLIHRSSRTLHHLIKPVKLALLQLVTCACSVLATGKDSVFIKRTENSNQPTLRITTLSKGKH